MRPKVCVVTTVHSASDTRVFHKQVKTLSEAGYEVTLIAQRPETPVQRVPVANIRVKELRTPRNRLDRMLRLSVEAFRWAWREQADIYHFHDPELLFVGLLLRVLGKKVIYDVHEDVPLQVLSKPWIPLPLRHMVSWIVRFLEGSLSRFFSAVVTVTPCIAERFAVNGCEVVLVQNYPNLNELQSRFCDAVAEPTRRQSVIYIGGITAIRGIREMVEAIGRLQSSLNITLILAGRFDDARLEEEMRSVPDWERVRFVGWIDRYQVRELLSQAMAGLVLFHPEPNHITAQPNKLFEYMAAGIPVIASDFPLWREMVERHDCGLLVNPLAPGEVAEAIRYFAENPDICKTMGDNGRRAVEQIYNWESEAKKLLALYETLCS